MKTLRIDVSQFKPYNTRASAKCKAFLKSVPLEKILSFAGWNSCGTFAKLYNKPVANTVRFITALLKD